ncbi:MAG: protein kinase domain-containing protein, partial [Lysobacterales bacterium]
MDLAVGIAHFLASAARLATLHHPAISGVLRWFKANGTAYMVMPWSPGQVLSSLLLQGRALDAGETAKLAMPLLDALDYLHGQGFIQQELAPDSIQVLDAGGAALLGPGAATHTKISAGETDAAAGDPYAAIEQVRHDGPIGPWTDIYRLAATFYYCITGHAPPPAAEREAAVQVGRADPLVPIVRPATASQAQREMSTLIERGLALEVSARPKTVREWRARIAPSPDASEITVPETGVVKPAEGREWLPIFLLAAFLAGVVGIGWYLLTHQETGVDATSASAAAASGAEEAERWRQALEANAVLTYREFIGDFPQSKHLQQAQEQIDTLEDKAW